MFWPLKNPAREAQFIWASERTGFRHLYLLDRSGNLVCQVTQGDWVVDKIVQVDEEHDLVYFLATLPDPTQSQLYSAPLTGGEPRRITQQAGTHEVVFDHACRTFIDIHSALDQPPTVTLRSLADAGLLKTIYPPQDARLDQLKDLAPKLVTLQNRCGTTLYGALYRPSAEFGPGPYPTIVTVYGGPSAQMVTDSTAPG